MLKNDKFEEKIIPVIEISDELIEDASTTHAIRCDYGSSEEDEITDVVRIQFNLDYFNSSRIYKIICI